MPKCTRSGPVSARCYQHRADTRAGSGKLRHILTVSSIITYFILCIYTCFLEQTIIWFLCHFYHPELPGNENEIHSIYSKSVSKDCHVHFPRTNLQHRISATGWLLFMRCVSFTFIRLLTTWTPTEIFDSFWAKHFSDCDSIICSINSKLRFLKVCKILKRTWHFQTDWILCVLNCSGCSHVVSDAGSTCSWC